MQQLAELALGVDGGVLMTVSLGVSPARSTSTQYGDYAPPPGAYVQRGDIATLTYPIDGRITDDGSHAVPRRSRAVPPLLLALLPVGAAAADRAEAAAGSTASCHVVGGRSRCATVAAGRSARAAATDPIR